ncbi:hypothetical protein, partial [Roseobacter sp. HKCCD5927]|uniref:hypothetical protein n=1 Tax=Roseobacter sp. HKCCD5927 TaxID=2690575 RepID=UPI001C101A95
MLSARSPCAEPPFTMMRLVLPTSSLISAVALPTPMWPALTAVEPNVSIVPPVIFATILDLAMRASSSDSALFLISAETAKELPTPVVVILPPLMCAIAVVP